MRGPSELDAAVDPADGPAGAPVVTVVIPCYEQAHFLAEAIESALGQTEPRVEVVVVDDGSRDGTSEVAASFAGVRCLRQPNRGLGAARNLGLRHGRGGYLIFLDADDRLRPNAVADGLAALGQRPECGFAYGGYGRFSPDGRRWEPVVQRPPAEDLYEALLLTNFIAMHGACIFRREVFDRVGGYDEGLRASEDYDLYFRVARRFQAAAHRAVVADVRKHPASMTGDSSRMLCETLRVHRRQRRYARASPRWRAAYRRGRARWKSWYGNDVVAAALRLARRRRPIAALRQLLALLRCYPYGLWVLLAGLARRGLWTYRVELPRERILSVRIDPTDAPRCPMVLDSLRLLLDGETISIPLDRADDLQLVRMELLGPSGNGGRYRGTGDAPGWLAPGRLRGLDLAGCRAPALVLRMTVAAGRQLRIYWDTGSGYSFAGRAALPLRAFPWLDDPRQAADPEDLTSGRWSLERK